MNAAASKGTPKALVLAIVVAAIVVGWMVGKVPIEWLLAVVLGAIAVGMVFYDYRAGVVCLAILLPSSWSPLIPQTSGFNVVNFLVLASLASFFLKRSFEREKIVWLPRIMLWCYFLPIIVAAFIAWPHLAVGQANFPSLQGHVTIFEPAEFVRSKLTKPMFFVLYAFLLANAVRDSKRPEWFFVPFVIAALIPAISIIGRVSLGGIDVNDRDHFLPELGLQVNEYGALLALTVGPLLFICTGSGPRKARFAAGVTLAVVSVAIAMTASRAGAAAYLVTVVVWLIKRRRFSDLLIIVALLGVLAAVVPDQVTDRLTMGFSDLSATRTDNSDDPLTQGRVYIWASLAPDFLLSPIWGNGLSSIGWNSAITSGRLWLVGHPHSTYLSMALDLGIVGTSAILYMLFRFGRSMRRLSTEASFSPLLRDYFAGAFAAFLGMASISVTEGYYTAHPEQSYLWYSFGFTFAYWALAQITGSKARPRKPFGWGVKAPEMLLAPRLGPPR